MNGRTEILCKGGRTGRKVHRAWTDSASTACGLWLRHDARHFRVAIGWEPAPGMPLCEHCFPPPAEDPGQ